MKRVTPLLSIILFATLCLSSCKKDKDDPGFDMGGTTWTGSFDVGNFAYPDMTMKFQANGDLEVSIPGVNTWVGYWTMTPGTGTVNVNWFEDPNNWAGSGQLNATNTELTGDVDRSPATATASFNLTKN